MSIAANQHEAADEEAKFVQPTTKKKVLNAEEFKRVCDFIMHFKGLAIECASEMQHSRFPNIHFQTLKSIQQTENNIHLRSNHWRYEANAKKYLQHFEEISTSRIKNRYILVQLAIEEYMNPVILCRALLQEKYRFKSKSDLSYLLKHPHLIEPPILSANVIQCLCSDTQDGPLIDLRRRVLGEEYELQLKMKASGAGMHFHDEHALRRMGFDKTPDIKMIVPFLYKGQVVNWIESKASFADIKTHKWNVQQQLSSYCNRFGAGIVIYWFGYHEETPLLAENNVGIIVLADFPSKEEMVFLDLDEDSEEATATESISL